MNRGRFPWGLSALVAFALVCLAALASAPDGAEAQIGRPAIQATSGIPSIDVFPSTIVFPDQILNTHSPLQQVVVANFGTGALKFSGLSITNFYVGTSNCWGKTLAVNAHSEITVFSDPGLTGETSGSLSIYSDAPTGVQVVSLSVNASQTHPVPVLTSVSQQAIKAGADTYIDVTGANIYSDTVLEWNGTKLKSTPTSPTTLEALVPNSLLEGTDEGAIKLVSPHPGGGASASMTETVYRKVPVSARDMVYDKTRKLIYLSADTNSISYPDEVVSLDPATGGFGPAIMKGNTPGKLAITPDSKYLFIETDKNSTVTRIDLATGSEDLKFQIPPSPYGPLTALDMVPVPGDDSSVAMALTVRGVDNVTTYSVQVFKDGKPQPTAVTNSDTFTYYLLYGNNANTLYGSEGDNLSSDLLVFSEKSGRLTLTGDYNNLGTSQIATDGRNLFIGGGQVVSLAGFKVIDTLPFFDLSLVEPTDSVTVDQQAKEAYFGENVFDPYTTGTDWLSGTLYFVDSTNFKVLGSIPFLNPYEKISVDHIVRWGEDGLAFRSSNSFLPLPGLGTPQDGIVLLHSGLAANP